MGGKTKKHIEEILKILLEAERAGKGELTENEIARRLVERMNDITSEDHIRGKINRLQRSQKMVYNLLSPKSRYYKPLVLFTVPEKTKKSGNRHRITFNGVLWLFREGAISLKDLLEYICPILVEFSTEDAFEPDKGIKEKENKNIIEKIEIPEILEECIQEEKNNLQKYFAYIFKSNKREPLEAIIRRYLNKFNLENHAFGNFEKRCILSNILEIFYATIYPKDLESFPWDILPIVRFGGRNTNREENRKTLLITYDVFEMEDIGKEVF